MELESSGSMTIELSRTRIRQLLSDVLEAHGLSRSPDESEPLDGIGFRSLHFAELALRVEDDVGTELNFDAPQMRAIETVGDVLDFFEHLEAR